MSDEARRWMWLTNDELGFLVTCLEARRGVTVGELTSSGRAFGERLQARLERAYVAPDERLPDASNDAAAIARARPVAVEGARSRLRQLPPARSWLQALAMAGGDGK